MTGEALKGVARRWILGVWDEGNLGLLDELASTSYSYSAPGYPGLGRQAFETLVREMRAAFPDLHNAIEQQIAEGKTVVTRGTTRGTHRGPFAGIAPTGRQIAVPWVIVTEFDGDRITSDWETYDSLAVMQQLGAPTAATSNAQPDLAADEAHIRRVDAQLVEALNARDLDRWLSLFAPDAELMPPGAPAPVGRAAIHQFVGELFTIPSVPPAAVA